MATTNRPTIYRVSPSMKWSLYAGFYVFACGIVPSLILYPMNRTLVALLGVPDQVGLLVASPAVGIGAGAWWVIVERRGVYTYTTGAVFGLLTTLFTVLLWLVLFTIKFGQRVLIGDVLIAFALAVTLPVGVVAGVSATYARRRLIDRPPDRAKPSSA